MLKTFELQAKEGKEPQLYEQYIERFQEVKRKRLSGNLMTIINNRLSGN